MRCSATTFVLTLMTMLTSYLSLFTCYVALNQTIELIKKYGPVQGDGNPILDLPDTNQFKIDSIEDSEFIDIQHIFGVVQTVSIILAVVMASNCILFMWDSVRSKKLFERDPTMMNKDSVMRKMTCSGWLTGYSVFLAIIWLVIVILATVPVFDYQKVDQTCEDLKHNYDDPTTYRHVCINLVDLGLVRANPTKYAQYGNICGRDASAKLATDQGSLNGICLKYRTTYDLFLASLVSAVITVISLVLFAVLHAANFTHVKERRMHFVILNGITGTMPSLPPQHQAVMQNQLLHLQNSASPYGHNNMVPGHQSSSAYLYNNTMNSMETVDEEHAMNVDHDGMEMRNLTARSHVGRPSSRASTLRVQYKSSRAPSRAPSMSTVNGVAGHAYNDSKHLQQPETDAMSVHSHMTNNNDRSRTKAFQQQQQPDFEPVESEEDEEDEMKRVGDGSSGGGDKKRHRSVSDRESMTDEELAATLPHPNRANAANDLLPPHDMSDDDYDGARSVRSYRHPRQSRSLYKKKRPRGAQSDTDISRHVGYPSSARRHSSSQRQRQQQRPGTAQRAAGRSRMQVGDEYDSPPSDFYQKEDQLLRSTTGRKGGAYV